jgi:excisionase family DNA binding protein
MADLLTTAEACQLLRCHRNTLINMANRGQLAPIRLNQRRILYRRSDIETLLDPPAAHSDALTVAAALQRIAEQHAAEQRPLCTECGRRRVNRGHSFCTYCEQSIEAQLEHKRRWWEANNAAANAAKRARRAQQHQEPDMPDQQPDHDNQDQPQTTDQPARRMPLRTTIPPREQPTPHDGR